MTFPLKIVGLLKSKVVTEKILITMTPTAGFTAGINLTFASGTLQIDWKDGSPVDAFVSGVEKTHTYASASTYVAEITGDLANITEFIADNNRITFISGFKTGLLVDYKLDSNLYSGVINLSGATVSGTIRTNSNSSATGLIFASSGNGIVTEMNLPLCNYSSLDFTNVRIDNFFHCWINPNLTSITFAASGNGTLFSFNLDSCNLNYVDFTTFNFDANSCRLRMKSNGMVAADVNHVLVDLYSLVSGEGAGGDYTGRRIELEGSNAAPDSSSGGYNGTQAVIDLTAKGFNVTTS